MATDFELKVSEIEDGFAATTMFLRASDELIGDTLHPNAPLTQTEMNIAASTELDAALRDVKSLSDAIRKTLEPERIEQFNRADAAWVAFMEAWATFAADAYKGGTIWPTIYGGAATELARARAGELKDHLRRHERSKGEV